MLTTVADFFLMGKNEVLKCFLLFKSKPEAMKFFFYFIYAYLLKDKITCLEEKFLKAQLSILAKILTFGLDFFHISSLLKKILLSQTNLDDHKKLKENSLRIDFGTIPFGLHVSRLTRHNYL